MQIEYVKIKRFKNLINFEIILDNSQNKTVLIGQNASGKSNFLEAVVLIFKCLDFDFDIKKIDGPELFQGFEIKYSCYGNNIHVLFSPALPKKWHLIINEKSISQVGFIKGKEKFLPRYILAYYSGLGNSNRLEIHFEDHKEKFAKIVVKAKDLSLPDYPRMQYAELIHSQFSLFSFFIDEDPKLKEFLKENLFIEDIQSTLLSVREPEWATSNTKEKDQKFWGSTGVVKSLLYYLHDNVAIAPLRSVASNKSTLWKKEKKKSEVVYLYFSDFSKIRSFVKQNKWSSFDFFHILNTANVSRLFTHEGIRIRVKKKHANKISFGDLSEGEQQLLTVLGLMRFTSGTETLFLLDEPDTHLNPYWRWKYMDFIDEIVFKDQKEGQQTTQVIMTSHDPLTIGSLIREAVRIFETDSKTGNIITYSPQEDPKGMGVAGILTEIFKLRTTLDNTTQEQLERRRTLESKRFNKLELSNEEQKELEDLNHTLDNLGFSRFTRDPLYQKFQAAFDKEMKAKPSNDKPLSADEEKSQKEKIDEILKKILSKESI